MDETVYLSERIYNVMSDTKKASRVEWLCAAMIDFIPAVFFRQLTGFLSHDLGFSDLTYVLAILLAVYILLKDFFFDGRSVGKRLVGIQIVRLEESDKSCLILRNLPLSLMVLLWGWQEFSIPTSMWLLGFVFYMWADFICFALKGKTLGDCLAHTSIEVCEDQNNIFHKNTTKRIACLIVVLILTIYEASFISPVWPLILSQDFYYSSSFVNHYLFIYFPYLCVLYVFYKIIKEYSQSKDIDATVIVMIAILLFIVPAVSSLLSECNILLLFSFLLLHIVTTMFPVLYLCKKFIRRTALRWIIYVMVLVGVILCDIPNIRYLISPL